MLSWSMPAAGPDPMGHVNTWGFAAPLPDEPAEPSDSEGQLLDWAPSRDPHDARDGRVHWAATAEPQQQQQQPAPWPCGRLQDGDAPDRIIHEEERARKASGRSRKGSFYPGHDPAHDLHATAKYAQPAARDSTPSRGPSAGSASRGSFAGAAGGDRGRPGTAFQGIANRGASAGSSQDGGRARGSVHDAASLAFGYQSYSLKDYREQHFDPKTQEYWVLGKLGPEPESAELHHKKEIAERVRDLSAAIRERNLAVVGTSALGRRSRSPSPGRQARSSVSPVRRTRDGSPLKRQQSARERARDYAQSLSKGAAQRSRSPQKRAGSDAKPGAAAAAPPQAAPSQAAEGRPTEDLDLEQLRELHRLQKQQIEHMRRELQGALRM